MNKLRPIFVLLIGIGMIIGGIVQANDDRVMCGSEEMTSANQVCEETSNGSTTTRTMSEQQDSNKTTGYILLGIGALMFLGGTAWTVSEFRKRKQSDAGQQGFGQQPQGFGPPPGQPQQQQFAQPQGQQQYPQSGPMPQHGPPSGPQQMQPVPQGQPYGPPPQQFGPPPGQPQGQPQFGPQGGQPGQQGGQWGPPPGQQQGGQWGPPPR